MANETDAGLVGKLYADIVRRDKKLTHYRNLRDKHLATIRELKSIIHHRELVIEVGTDCGKKAALKEDELYATIREQGEEIERLKTQLNRRTFTDPDEANMENQRMRGIVKGFTGLVHEVVVCHALPESSDYNECDTAECAWCTEAKELMAATRGRG